MFLPVSRFVSLTVALLAFASAGCDRSPAPPASTTTANDPVAIHPAKADCGAHAACGDGYVVDVTPAPCRAKEPCGVEVRVEATGKFHINDEYPYKFSADAPPAGVQFKSADATNPALFSKAGGEWTKTAEKTGTMKTTLVAEAPGSVPFAGTMKLSVCSAETCMLEAPHVKQTIAMQ